MQLETILCEFGQICATGNALMLLETILCKFGQICATGNTLMQLGATLYKSGQQICETGTALMPLETNYVNMDRSVRKEMVLCGWNQIYATDCCQELHFEFSRQNLNWNVQSPSMW